METEASAFALLMAPRQAAASAKLPVSAGGATPSKSDAAGQGAQCTKGSVRSSAKLQDQTSSVM